MSIVGTQFHENRECLIPSLSTHDSCSLSATLPLDESENGTAL